MSARIGSPYGYRDDPINPGRQQFHGGQDFPARTGTPMYATKPLIVKQNTFQMGANGYGYGNQIVLEDPVTGQRYRMAHLDERPKWKPGETVKAGETIGHVGNTGGSTGSHLHWEVINNGKPQDPALYKDSTPVTWNKEGKGTLWDTLKEAKPDPNYRRGSSSVPGATTTPPGNSSDPIADLLRRQEEEKQRRRQQGKEVMGQSKRSNEPSRSTKKGQGLTTGSPWHQLHDGG
jgi:hypothetical protein